MAAKKPRYRTTANPEFSKAMHALASSNAATPHDSRPKRGRTRLSSKSRSIREQLS